MKESVLSSYSALVGNDGGRWAFDLEWPFVGQHPCTVLFMADKGTMEKCKTDASSGAFTRPYVYLLCVYAWLCACDRFSHLFLAP